MSWVSCLFLVVMLTFLGVQGSFYPCRPCVGDECDLEPEDCKYGTARDPCNRLICAAGPGERCGGRDNHIGKCGEGMNCRCGTCRGCSTVRFLQGFIDCEWNHHMCNS
uniref:Neuroparsin-A n=1 Tax=Lygus hesperus TaxID=30085 RepID=A0A0A9YFR1_LYGHE